MYRLKADSGMPESIAMVRLKDTIRERYKVKNEKFTKHYVGDYSHDVIIHSTDNYLSNKAVKLLLEINKDISDLFDILRNYDYSILESGTDKISSRFPHNFYLNDDIDIFVRRDELEKIFKIIYDYSKQHFNYQWVSIVAETSPYGKRVRILLKNCLIIMFDLMICLPGLKDKYISDCIINSEYDTYRHLCMEDELTVRLAKYSAAPSKVWHADFINKNQKKFVFNEEAFLNPHKMKKLYKKIISNNL